jgi:hypothetical protein
MKQMMMEKKKTAAYSIRTRFLPIVAEEEQKSTEEGSEE